MDYGSMLADHLSNQADLTVGCIDVPIGEASEFGVMAVNADSRIISFREKPENPTPIPGNDNLALASMGIYIFNTKFLIEQLIRDADNENSDHDFGKDIIPYVVRKGYNIHAYPFRSEKPDGQVYWRDVGTVDAYYEANMELIAVTPVLNLYDKSWPIWSYQEQLPPAKFIFNDDKCRGMAVDSMVSGGCIISGSTIKHSLLFSNVRVQEHSLVEDSVILPNVRIGKNCKIKNAIIDKSCVIEDGVSIGYDSDEDSEKYHVSPRDRILVTPEMLDQEIHHVR
jgi:glucose-1-phosphate adenylyltransferase